VSRIISTSGGGGETSAPIAVATTTAQACDAAPWLARLTPIAGATWRTGGEKPKLSRFSVLAESNPRIDRNPRFDGRQPLARVLPDKLGHCRLLRADRRRFVVELPARPRKGEALDEQQVLDSQDLFDVSPPVHTRATLRLRHTEIRKLRLPRAQHVWLQLDEIAHFRRLEQRAIGDLNLNGKCLT